MFLGGYSYEDDLVSGSGTTSSGSCAPDIDLWHTRPLEGEPPYLLMDDVWCNRSRGGSVEKASVHVGGGVHDHCRVIGVEGGGWKWFVGGMIECGFKGVRLVADDRCAGLVSTVDSMLPNVGC